MSTKVPSPSSPTAAPIPERDRDRTAARAAAPAPLPGDADAAEHAATGLPGAPPPPGAPDAERGLGRRTPRLAGPAAPGEADAAEHAATGLPSAPPPLGATDAEYGPGRRPPRLAAPGDADAAGPAAAGLPRPPEDPSATTLLWSPAPEARTGRPGYQLGRRIGAGGYAEVFEAELRRPPLPPQRVALKRLLPGLRGDPAKSRQLRREAEIATRLGHENIVKVFELLDLGDELAIVMELCDGLQGSWLLHRLARRGRRLRLSAVAYLLRGLFAALDYLQTRCPLREPTPAGGRPLGSSRPLVHADISLENLMLTVEGRVKLIDFGLAAEDRSLPPLRPTGEEPSLTALRQVAGKRSYAPPAAGLLAAPTVRSDLYAAGVCAWELFTGLRFPLLPPGTAAPELGSLIAFAAEGLPEAAWRLLKLCLAAEAPAAAGTAAQGLALIQRLRPDHTSPPAMGALVQALKDEEPWSPDQAQALAATVAETAPLGEELLRRVHGAFCAHRVLWLVKTPESGLSSSPTLPPLLDRRDPPRTPRAEFTVQACRGAPGEPPSRSVLHQALRTGYARDLTGGLCYRVQPPTAGAAASILCIDPGPGRTYEPLAEALLRSLLGSGSDPSS